MAFSQPSHRRYYPWQSTLRAMVIVQFLLMMAVTTSFPLLPLFLEDELGLTRGRDVELWSGIISSAHFLTMGLFSPVWGALGDRHGRKLMVIRSTAAVGVFNALTVLATDRYQLLAIRLCMGMLSGFGATATSFVAAVTPRERLGYAMGLMGTGQLAGAVIGPLLGGLISSYFGYRTAFLSTGLLALGACVLTAASTQEDFVLPAAGERAARPRMLESIAGIMGSRDLSRLFVVLLLGRLTIGGVAPITTLLVEELGVVPRLVPTVAGLCFSAAGLGAAITAPLLGRLGDRVGYRPILLGALAGSALLFLPLAAVKTAWQLLILRFLLGLLSGGVEPVAHALVGKTASPGQQSTVYGLCFSANAAGGLTGSLLSGLVAANLGLRSVFVYSAALTAINAAWVSTRVRERKESAACRRGQDAQVGSRGL